MMLVSVSSEKVAISYLEGWLCAKAEQLFSAETIGAGCSLSDSCGRSADRHCIGTRYCRQ